MLPDYDNWEIMAYYATSRYAVDEIMEQLWLIDIDANNAKRAFDNLSSNDLDTGLCYSNYSLRKSVIVVALTTTASEFMNSLTHEIAHACIHISTALGIDKQSEDFAYMMGDLCQIAFNKTNSLLCEHCRKC